MTAPVEMAQVWRGDFLECVHMGHAVVCNAQGEVVQAWGDPDLVVLPRSSCKMIQALPLVESGAADAAGLTSEHLALACASHNGASIHVDRVRTWLDNLGLGDDDLRCGGHVPRDKEQEKCVICGHGPDQVHNNCSGKHAGFLTLTRHLGAGPEYIEADHPVQLAVKEAFEDVSGEDSPGFAIDGCSAPNFATSLKGMARAMAFYANAGDGSVRDRAAVRLRQAMVAHPELVAGEGRSCTELMRAMDSKVALKTGAEGYFAAILPELGLGVALKIVDGQTRGAECAIASMLVELGVLDADHPAAQKFLNAPITNCRGIDAAYVRPGAAFAGV
ncbi:asparaginase [Alisedimentitalea sp. MJ-SS2]|uniref:asparaginase n=1 Tax=Aliisedimentitalea sp. MJ-SS2 TaxID=3049795 RepID=UPI00290CFFC9|nr:asparaginase [Alisedimentitalea sp. MJ-SS2]MDU8929474.1 asparaginase [Alisedimentitalea sp. MJ-SS2]